LPKEELFCSAFCGIVLT